MGKQFNLNLSSRQEASSKTMILQNMIEGSAPEYQYLNINNIHFNNLNDYASEDSADSIRELANDIQRHGLLHNIVVSYTQTGQYKLLSGERRLRAYQLLYNETGEQKYQKIYALVRKGLSDLEEMIILDAANLQSRGGMSGEKRYRKASVRFIDNLKKQYNISEEEAILLTKQYAGVTDAVIEKNIAIEKELHPGIRELLDEGSLPKQQAYEYSRMNEELQQTISEKLSKAKQDGEKTLRDVNSAIYEPAKKVKLLSDELSKKKEDLKEIRKEVRKEGNPQTAETLSAQAKTEKKNIKNIQKEIEKEVQKIEEASAPSLPLSSSFSLISNFSSSLSSLLSNLPLSLLSSSEKEKIKKELEKEKKRLEKYMKENL